MGSQSRRAQLEIYQDEQQRVRHTQALQEAVGVEPRPGDRRPERHGLSLEGHSRRDLAEDGMGGELEAHPLDDEGIQQRHGSAEE